MESNSPKGIKVPLIFISVAVLVIAAGIFVRSRNSSSSSPPPETAPAPEPVPAPEPASAQAPEPEPMPAQPPETIPAQSPEPEPEIRFSSLVETDGSGDNWRLGLKAIPPQLPEGATRAGEPLLVKADVRGAGSYISIGLIIQGQAGEVYEPGAARNGRLMPAPTFKIFDESGKELGSGWFEYG